MSKDKIFVEILGTFFLTFVVALTGSPFAVGAVLIALVYAGGHISGAHYNPAVSLAQFVAKRITLREFFYYSFSQLAGAIFATATFALLVGSAFTLSPNPQATSIQIFISEAIFTFILAFVVLSVTSKLVKGNQFFGLAIGLTVMAGAFSVGGITGGIFNPAITLSASAIDTQNINSSLSILGLFLSSQIIAGLVAGLIARIQPNK